MPGDLREPIEPDSADPGGRSAGGAGRAAGRQPPERPVPRRARAPRAQRTQCSVSCRRQRDGSARWRAGSGDVAHIERRWSGLSPFVRLRRSRLRWSWQLASQRIPLPRSTWNTAGESRSEKRPGSLNPSHVWRPPANDRAGGAGGGTGGGAGGAGRAGGQQSLSRPCREALGLRGPSAPQRSVSLPPVPKRLCSVVRERRGRSSAHCE